MQVLLTNDDGPSSPGLLAMAHRLVACGHRVVVVAPAEDSSGASAAIGPVRLDRAGVLRRTILPGLESIVAYSMPSPPAMCVLTAFLGDLGARPDIVISGINAGPNAGRVILHSGTVGAALTAANFGCRAVAVSHASMKEPRKWDSAATLTTAVLPWLAKAPQATVLNLNVPADRDGPVPKLRVARLAEFGPEMRIHISPPIDGTHEMAWEFSNVPFPGGTDANLLSRGYATVTPLSGISESDSRLDELIAMVHE
jgi:5'-nucleotidase